MASVIAKFCSKFNYAAKARKKTCIVPDRPEVKEVLDLFKEQYYVRFYFKNKTEKETLIVYLNSFAINFRIKPVERIHRKNVGWKWIIKNRSRGNKCILRTKWGLHFSNFHFYSSGAGEPILYTYFKK